MMNKKIKIFLFILSLVLYSPSSNAWIVMKLSNMGEDIATFTTKVTKNAQKQLDNVASLTVVKQIGKGVQESKAWLETNSQNFKKFSAGVQKQIDAAKQAASEVQKTYQQNIGNYTTLYNDLNSLNEERKKLTDKIEETKQSLSNEIDAIETMATGKIEAYQENIANLNQMIAEQPETKEEYEQQKAMIEELIKAEQKNVQTLIANKKQEFETLISEYSTQLKSLGAKLDKVKADLELIAGLSGEEKSAEESLTQTAETYFLKFDETETPQRQEEIRINRLLERRRSIIDAYSQSLKYIPELSAMNYDAESLGYNAAAFDTIGGAWGASANMQIQNLKALSNYAHLLIYDIKRQTAIEVANLKFYKLEKNLDDIGKFNIDDYIWNK